ncbi:MAG: CvpA family protein [Magnetospirillum sp. WYHS-4]
MADLPVNVVDIVVGIVLLISALLAYSRGFVHETLSVAGWVGAIFATIWGFPLLRPYARGLIPKEMVADIAAGTLIFVVSLFALSILTHLLSSRIRHSALGALDRALGFLFGLVRGAILVALAYMGAEWLWPKAEFRPTVIAQARTAPLMAGGARMLRSVLPESAQAAGEQVDEFARETEKLLESQKALRNMLDVKPKGPEAGAGTAAPPPGQEGGYDPRERRDMQRLIENQ